MEALPNENQLKNSLDLRWGEEIEPLLAEVLLSPLKEFLARPSKKMRGKLVHIGFRLIHGENPETDEARHNRETLATVLEELHGASLVIDDIQDDSEERRGAPALHRKLGIPIALNAGNWLYFWPLRRLSTLSVPASIKLSLTETCIEALSRAHAGQAIDLATPVDSLPLEAIPKVCLASLELKTGALTALSLSAGAILAGGSRLQVSLAERFGRAFGVALQMFDDIGNVTKPGIKQFEDLKLRRPSWVWATLARECSPSELEFFKRLPPSPALLEWLSSRGLLAKMRAQANDFLESALAEGDELAPSVELKNEIRHLAKELTLAYQ